MSYAFHRMETSIYEYFDIPGIVWFKLLYVGNLTKIGSDNGLAPGRR